jgi:hypothetical protein
LQQRFAPAPMNSLLPPDDSFPRLTPLDRRLHQQLQDALDRTFAESCNPILHSLLAPCHWHFAITASTVDFTLHCPTNDAYWHIIAEIEPIARQVEKLTSGRSRICIFPPDNRGVSLQIEVHELLA